MSERDMLGGIWNVGEGHVECQRGACGGHMECQRGACGLSEGHVECQRGMRNVREGHAECRLMAVTTRPALGVMDALWKDGTCVAARDHRFWGEGTSGAVGAHRSLPLCRPQLPAAC